MIRLPKSALKHPQLAKLLQQNGVKPKRARALTPKRVAKMLRPDNGIPVELPAVFVIRGAPRTKKTSQRKLKRGDFVYIVPSKAYEEWNKQAIPQLTKQLGSSASISVAVNCRALVLRKAKVGDACGFYQAIADTLQDAGVVVNDSQIVSWDGSRLESDPKDPRVIITLEKAQ